jgi:hypothetical protein
MGCRMTDFIFDLYILRFILLPEVHDPGWETHAGIIPSSFTQIRN